MDILFGLATALPIVSATSVGVVTGVAQGVSEQKRVNADAANQTRMLKFHIDVACDSSAILDGGIVVLHDDKLWIEPQNPATGWPVGKSHPFTGFYLAYPDDNRPYTRGLVSTVTVDPPLLNWIYIDTETLEVKYANRSGSLPHHVGSFDWTSEAEEDSCVVFDEFEGFVAVEEEGGRGWAVYFDLEDDGLRKRRKGRKVVEVSLVRRVIRGQEVNKWGLTEEGNMGFRKTREV